MGWEDDINAASQDSAIRSALLAEIIALRKKYGAWDGAIAFGPYTVAGNPSKEGVFTQDDDPVAFAAARAAIMNKIMNKLQAKIAEYNGL